jgi:hypothetical protein
VSEDDFVANATAGALDEGEGDTQLRDLSICKWHRTFHHQLKASLPIPKQITPYDQTPTKNPCSKTSSSEVMHYSNLMVALVFSCPPLRTSR